MKKRNLFLAFAFLLAGTLTFAQAPDAITAYIQQYKDIAIQEMQRTGVPASITLAQGVHETFAGQSVLVQKSNNHFGIKCKSNWQGESVSHDDDARGECFRKYPTPEQSYKDHSDFLRNGTRYASLFELDPTDYEAWAWGLKKAGYATNPKYPQLLIKLIRDYNLQDYTLIALGRKTDNGDEYWVKNNRDKKKEVAPEVVPAVVVETKKTIYPAGVFKINATNVIFAEKGTSYLAVAQLHNIPLSRLFEFNDLPTMDVAAHDQLIYLQRKRKTGASDVHTVTGGENLHQIAQAEGIRLESLLEYNFLHKNMQPQVGEVLYLNKKAPATPRLATATAIVTVVSNSNSFAKSDNYSTEKKDFLVHVVQPKETVYSISKKYAVRTDDVVRWNDLQTASVQTGQQLRIKKM